MLFTSLLSLCGFSSSVFCSAVLEVKSVLFSSSLAACFLALFSSFSLRLCAKYSSFCFLASSFARLYSFHIISSCLAISSISSSILAISSWIYFCLSVKTLTFWTCFASATSSSRSFLVTFLASSFARLSSFAMYALNSFSNFDFCASVKFSVVASLLLYSLVAFSRSIIIACLISSYALSFSSWSLLILSFSAAKSFTSFSISAPISPYSALSSAIISCLNSILSRLLKSTSTVFLLSYFVLIFGCFVNLNFLTVVPTIAIIIAKLKSTDGTITQLNSFPTKVSSSPVVPSSSVVVCSDKINERLLWSVETASLYAASLSNWVTTTSSKNTYPLAKLSSAPKPSWT